ncbi:hypothetical protein D1Y78_01445 [Riemerella anatipestifer]|nr:hypothetical protein [Riemerella anatipestifer]
MLIGLFFVTLPFLCYVFERNEKKLYCKIYNTDDWFISFYNLFISETSIVFQTIILVVLLFLIPILFTASKQRNITEFKLKSLIQILNKVLIAQLCYGIVLFIIVYFPDFRSNKINIVQQITTETSCYFILIGAFYYFPF